MTTDDRRRMTADGTAYELVVVAGDDVGREVVPLAAQVLRATLPGLRLHDAEAGYDHAWRTGQSVDAVTLDLLQRVRYVLCGPERPFPEEAESATQAMTRALDLYAALYPARATAQQAGFVLLMEHRTDGAEVNPYRERKALSPEETWRATRLGNLASDLIKPRHNVTIIHDSEEQFAHAVNAGIRAPATAERLDAVFLVNHWAEMVGDLDWVVTSAATGRLLLDQLGPAQATARLLVGPGAAVATPTHGSLREQVGWGFASPLGAFHAVVALLRYGWGEDEAAQRLESAIARAATRRRAPDQGGLHTMYEVTHAILDELRREPTPNS